MAALAFVLGLLLLVARPADAQPLSGGDGNTTRRVPAAHVPPANTPRKAGQVVSASWVWPSSRPFNYWSPQDYAGPGADPSWGNVQAGTATDIPITPGIEFGWSAGLPLTIVPVWQATLDLSPPTASEVDVTLALRTKTPDSTVEATYGDGTGFVVTAVSDAFVGKSVVEVLPGTTLPEQPTSTQLDAATGTLVLTFPQIAVSSPLVELVQSATWRLRGEVVAQLVIRPHKTHRHVGEHAAVTADAFDRFGQPVAGAVITFSVYAYDESYGEHSHHAVVGQRTVTTNAQGRARVHIPSSSHPDAVTIVAAVRNPTGTTVVSRPAHIVWTDDGYEREEHYRRHRDAAEYDDAE